MHGSYLGQCYTSKKRHLHCRKTLMEPRAINPVNPTSSGPDLLQLNRVHLYASELAHIWTERSLKWSEGNESANKVISQTMLGATVNKLVLTVEYPRLATICSKKLSTLAKGTPSVKLTPAQTLNNKTI